MIHFYHLIHPTIPLPPPYHHAAVLAASLSSPSLSSFCEFCRVFAFIIGGLGVEPHATKTKVWSSLLILKLIRLN
jgi:hypothetical protein